MLAVRELSEAQVRARLARRKFDDAHIEAAIDRLRSERAIDDARTARAIARTTAAVRGQGKRRARMRVDAAGIARDIAAAAVEEVFGGIDAETLLRAALEKRLRGRTSIADDKEKARMFRYLIGQGFEADQVTAVLRAVSIADR